MKNSDVIQLQNSQILDTSKVAKKAFENDPVLINREI